MLVLKLVVFWMIFGGVRSTQNPVVTDPNRSGNISAAFNEIAVQNTTSLANLSVESSVETSPNQQNLPADSSHRVGRTLKRPPPGYIGLNAGKRKSVIKPRGKQLPPRQLLKRIQPPHAFPASRRGTPITGNLLNALADSKLLEELQRRLVTAQKSDRVPSQRNIPPKRDAVGDGRVSRPVQNQTEYWRLKFDQNGQVNPEHFQFLSNERRRELVKRPLGPKQRPNGRLEALLDLHQPSKQNVESLGDLSNIKRLSPINRTHTYSHNKGNINDEMIRLKAEIYETVDRRKDRRVIRIKPNYVSTEKSYAEIPSSKTAGSPSSQKIYEQDKKDYAELQSVMSQYTDLIKTNQVLEPTGRSNRKAITVHPGIVAAFEKRRRRPESSFRGPKTSVQELKPSIQELQATIAGPKPLPLHPQYEALKVSDGVSDVARVQLGSQDYYDKIFTERHDPLPDTSRQNTPLEKSKYTPFVVLNRPQEQPSQDAQGRQAPKLKEEPILSEVPSSPDGSYSYFYFGEPTRDHDRTSLESSEYRPDFQKQFRSNSFGLDAGAGSRSQTGSKHTPVFPSRHGDDEYTGRLRKQQTYANPSETGLARDRPRGRFSSTVRPPTSTAYMNYGVLATEPTHRRHFEGYREAYDPIQTGFSRDHSRERFSNTVRPPTSTTYMSYGVFATEPSHRKNFEAYRKPHSMFQTGFSQDHPRERFSNTARPPTSTTYMNYDVFATEPTHERNFERYHKSHEETRYPNIERPQPFANSPSYTSERPDYSSANQEPHFHHLQDDGIRYNRDSTSYKDSYQERPQDSFGQRFIDEDRRPGAPHPEYVHPTSHRSTHAAETQRDGYPTLSDVYNQMHASRVTAPSTASDYSRPDAARYDHSIDEISSRADGRYTMNGISNLSWHNKFRDGDNTNGSPNYLHNQPGSKPERAAPSHTTAPNPYTDEPLHYPDTQDQLRHKEPSFDIKPLQHRYQSRGENNYTPRYSSPGKSNEHGYDSEKLSSHSSDKHLPHFSPVSHSRNPTTAYPYVESSQSDDLGYPYEEHRRNYNTHEEPRKLATQNQYELPQDRFPVNHNHEERQPKPKPEYRNRANGYPYEETPINPSDPYEEFPRISPEDYSYAEPSKHPPNGYSDRESPGNPPRNHHYGKPYDGSHQDLPYDPPYHDRRDESFIEHAPVRRLPEKDPYEEANRYPTDDYTQRTPYTEPFDSYSRASQRFTEDDSRERPPKEHLFQEYDRDGSHGSGYRTHDAYNTRQHHRGRRPGNFDRGRRSSQSSAPVESPELHSSAEAPASHSLSWNTDDGLYSYTIGALSEQPEAAVLNSRSRTGERSQFLHRDGRPDKLAAPTPYSANYNGHSYPVDRRTKNKSL